MSPEEIEFRMALADCDRAAATHEAAVERVEAARRALAAAEAAQS